MLEYIYNEAVKDHTKIATEIAHYNRLEDDEEHEDRSFQYLYEAVNRYIRRNRREAMREANSKAIEGLASGKEPGAVGREPGTRGRSASRKGKGKGSRKGE